MSATNGTSGTNGAFTATNISSEVDRILGLVDVNSFIKSDKSASPEPQSSAPPVQKPAEPVLNVADQPTKAAAQPSTTPSIPPATSTLADFISAAKSSLLTPQLREQLSECILDIIAVTAAGAKLAPSSEPILKGVLAFSHNQSLPEGKGCTVITQGQTYPPHIAALLHATYGHSLDFDDTHAESSLHAGVTAISTALAETEHQLRQKPGSISNDQFLLSILIGYEVTIRIGVALGTSSYSRGFHNTSVAGIFGCVATLSVLRHLSPEVIRNAFGLAGSKAAGSMQYLANGSHNKRLHAGFAAHDAFLCVSLAEAGVIGADKIIEGDLGVLQGYTDRERADVDWQRLISGLGEKWEFGDSAIKPYAGCRMTHGFIEMANNLGLMLRDSKWKESGVISDDEWLKGIKKIKCTMPKANMILVGQRIPNKVHPENVVDAQFSAYYQTANAVVYGGTHDMAAYAEDRMHSEEIRGLCEKIECVVDTSMKGMSCRMDVFLQDEDGNTVEVVRREILEPLGERSHPFDREGVEKKFSGLMHQAYDGDKGRAQEVMSTIDELVDGSREADVIRLMDLLTVNPQQS